MITDVTLGSTVIQSPISFSGNGDQIIVPGVSGLTISVLQMFFVLSAAANLLYKSGTTALTGSMNMLANAGIFQGYSQLPLTCLVGNPFIINTSASAAAGGTIWYIQTSGVHG